MAKFLAVVGPTASGKTALAIALAKQLDGEIISADSMQIYREMNIGTATPTLEEQAGIPHHLMNFVSPGEEYSVAQFQAAAKQLIQEINDRGRLPIVAGGTGLYIHSLVYDLDFSSQKGDPEFRERMKKLAEEYGTAFLHDMLAQQDPIAAQRIHPNDEKRTIRRLEILRGGKGEKEYEFEKPNTVDQYQIIGLTKPREILYRDIDTRVDKMMEQGLLEEVKAIYRRYPEGHIALNAIGYKEFLPYLEGKCTLQQAVDLVKRNTRRFAKRQLTWFNRDKRILWFDVLNYPSVDQLTKEVIAHITL